MLNNFKMSFFRMRKFKLTYLLAIINVGLTLLCFFVEWLIDQLMNDAMIKEAMGDITLETSLPPISTNAFSTATGLCSSGLFVVIALLFVMIFFQSERSGFAKNLIGYRGNKMAFAGSNLLINALYTFAMLAIMAGLSLLCVALFYKNVTYEDAGKFVAYLLVSFLEGVAFISLINALGDLTGKQVLFMILGVTYVMYCTLVYELIDMGLDHFFNIETAVSKYTLLGGITSYFTGVEYTDYLRSGLIAAAVLVGSYFLDVLGLNKQELK